MFLEEPLGTLDDEGHNLLRQKVTVPICGDETLTTPLDMNRRIADGLFEATRIYGPPVVVHAWDGTASLMANDHADLAGDGLPVWNTPCHLSGSTKL